MLTPASRSACSVLPSSSNSKACCSKNLSCQLSATRDSVATSATTTSFSTTVFNSAVGMMPMRSMPASNRRIPATVTSASSTGP